tara:strand:+ start:434 stop:649 length:216 start_codon:yes stop_codon:yes gene_type:complete
MNREATIDNKVATLSRLDKEFTLRGSSGNLLNLPHFFFDHLEWNINDNLDISIIEDEDSKYSILIERRENE